MYYHRNIQAIGRRGCFSEFAAGDLYYLLSCSFRLGQLSGRDVSAYTQQDWQFNLNIGPNPIDLCSII